MSEESQVWHYGLMAERWGEFLHEAPELPFFEQAIKRFGQPVLDLACGAGRLLLPLRRLGHVVEGCDLSADMLAQCQRRADGVGLQVRLFNQAMHQLDLPHRYRMIYICDSFGLSGSRDNDLETLRRCHTHLREGGALVFNIQAEYSSREAWETWLPEHRATLPEPWPDPPAFRRAADGSQHRATFRVLDIDPLEQTYTRQVRLEKSVAGERVAVEEYTLRGNMYFKPEVVLMLKVAGFREVEVTGDYRQEPATSLNEDIIFTAIK